MCTFLDTSKILLYNILGWYQSDAVSKQILRGQFLGGLRSRLRHQVGRFECKSRHGVFGHSSPHLGTGHSHITTHREPSSWAASEKGSLRDRKHHKKGPQPRAHRGHARVGFSFIMGLLEGGLGSMAANGRVTYSCLQHTNACLRAKSGRVLPLRALALPADVDGVAIGIDWWGGGARSQAAQASGRWCRPCTH